jgi:hypothetical protein
MYHEAHLIGHGHVYVLIAPLFDRLRYFKTVKELQNYVLENEEALEDEGFRKECYYRFLEYRSV